MLLPDDSGGLGWKCWTEAHRLLIGILVIHQEPNDRQSHHNPKNIAR